MADRSVAVVLMAYGTPRSRDEVDVEAYYTDIRRGRPPTAEQLADLVRRYDAIGGLSPLLARTQAQRVAIDAALRRRGVECDVVLGFKHSAPSIEDAVVAARSGDPARIVGLVLAPHYSALSVGEYLHRFEAAADGLDVRTVRSWATDTALVAFHAREVRRVLATMPADTRVVFTAHSLPERVVTMGDPYPSELESTATAIAAAAALDRWSTAWQSAARTPEPWLGPDILTVIDGTPSGTGLVVCPCGFVSDHLEVRYDLDIQAAEHAAARDVAFARTASVNDDPAVMDSLAACIVRAAS